MPFLKHYFGLTLLLLSLPVAGGTRLRFDSIVAEQIDSSVPVSGGGAVGVAEASSDPAGAPASRLWIRLPADQEGILEIKVSSVDGRYLSTQHYKLTKGAQGWEAFELRTGAGSKRDMLFKSYARDHVAFAATLQPKPSAATQQKERLPLLLLSRVDPATTSRPLRTSILVNSLGAETVTIRVSGGNRQPCKPIRGVNTRVYDHACEVDLDQFAAASSVAKITRIRGADILEPIVVTIQ
jgi:hypothetical protein